MRRAVVPRAARGAAVALLASSLLPGVGRADTAEFGLRLVLEGRYGAGLAPEEVGAIDDALTGGVGALLSVGLSFHWSLTARYQYELSGGVQGEAPRDDEVARWRERRHRAMLGAMWTYSDALTPVVLAEGGLAARRTTQGRTVRRGAGVTTRDLPDADDLVASARLSLLWEWRFADFFSVAPGAFVDYTDGPGYGGMLWLAGYRYW